MCNEKEEEDNNNSLELQEMIFKIKKEYGSDLDIISDEKIKQKLKDNDEDLERTVMDRILATTNLIKGKK